ncbi:MAG: class I SAM-dependent methyltransferase [Microcoleaceae cyanobacterium]
MTENLKANKIIDDLLNDPELYRKMSKKEGEVWGRVFSDNSRSERVKLDQQAAQKLQLNRYALNLRKTLKDYGISPSIGCSLACGSGRLERQLLQQGICQSFHGIDIAADALSEAKRLAEQQQMNITYEQADLNAVQLDEQAYDLVVTQNCLHHVLRLEHVADEIAKSLRPEGVLWIHDYVGESQFQYSDKKLKIVNEILSVLPERMRYNCVNNSQINQVVRKEPGTLISPFESIRSEEIIPIFLERFEVVEKSEFSSILGLFCPVGTRNNFLENEEGRSIFEILLFFDKLLIDEGILPPSGAQYLLKPKSPSKVGT